VGVVATSVAYRPRRPRDTALHRVLSEHLADFLGQAEAHDHAVPEFVRAELEAILTCGTLEAGFARLLCRRCGHERRVAFSCRGRGICPSCLGRRMADTASRLVDRVIPEVPVRHWTLSLPHALRFIIAYEPSLCSAVITAFTSEVFAWLDAEARTVWDLPEHSQLYPGSVTALHRSDSAAKLNPHFHTLALDGVFAYLPPISPTGVTPGLPTRDPELRFLTTPAPSDADLRAIAWEVCLRTVAIFEQRGLAVDASADELADVMQGDLLPDPMLATCASASMRGVVLFGPRAGKHVLRLGAGPASVVSVPPTPFLNRRS